MNLTEINCQHRKKKTRNEKGYITIDYEAKHERTIISNLTNTRVISINVIHVM